MRVVLCARQLLARLFTQLGYPLPVLRQAGLVTSAGYDSHVNRIVFPLEANLYGRSLSASAPPHRLLPGSKGGLYGWTQVQSEPAILVEGISIPPPCGKLGSQHYPLAGDTSERPSPSPALRRPPTVYLVFDSDRNGSGQLAAQ
jgi:hypothetical protein